ncbi:MAG: ABC transporter substrate-binding protein [Candidatus Tectimicrobiota bacterium]
MRQHPRLAILLAILLLSLTVASAQTAPPVRIGLVQQVTHPALDAALKGVIDELKAAGFEEGKQLRLERQNAQNDIPTLATIAKKFKDDRVQYIVAIGTLPLQNIWAVFQHTETPVVFNSVTDPYAAGVARSATDKGENLTGIQASAPVEDAFKLIFEVRPGIKKVGMLWTATEKNSEIATGRARAAAQALQVSLEEATINKADEVLTAAQALAARKVEAFFISTDSTVVSALESLVKVAIDTKIPLFGNDPASAQRGAVCAFGLDYYDNGRNSGAMLVKLLQGARARDLPIEPQRKGQLACNTRAAALQRVTLPESVRQRVDITYDTIATPR